MRPLPFVWPHALLLWPLMFWVYWPELRILRQSKPNVKDAKSLQVILVGGQVSMLAAFIVAFVPAFQFTSFRFGFYLLGIALIVAASLLRRHCFRMLGSSFTGDVRASADQQVVTRGAYSILRHPSYSAGTLMNVGTGIALGSWLSALILLVASVLVYSYRIAVEERALVAAIGEPYLQFMRTRKRLIPFVY